MKLQEKRGIIVKLTVTTLLCAVLLCLDNGEGNSSNNTKIAISKAPFSCCLGCEEIIERWGLSGYSRYCQIDGLRHGKWIAFENGKLVIEGSFKLGNKDGQWIWYHSDGSIYRIVKYDSGSEVSDKIIHKE